MACDWRGLDALIADVERGLAEGRATIEPFAYAAVATDPLAARRCAALFAADLFPAQGALVEAGRRLGNAKIRVGYLGGEFRNQATSILAAELFELHDKSRFEIVMFDNGWDDGSTLRRRMNAAFDEVVPIATLADDAAAQATVFACFNNTYKITPATFASWMRILAAVDGSVLWLLEDNGAATRNLRAAAQVHGIDPARLHFAPRIRLDEHLARQACADLFLDTLPYNAHTTASDALWAGLPVLSCRGTTFPGRVGASLLHALGLADELLVDDAAAFEQRAIELARDGERLARLRERLAQAHGTAPLWDTPAYCRALEQAYAELLAP